MDIEEDKKMIDDSKKSTIKKEIALTALRTGLFDKDFTGKILLNINQGGIVDIDKTEKIK